MSSTAPRIRNYRESDREQLVESLGLAFMDDPIFTFLFTGARSRRIALEWLHGLAISTAISIGGRVDVAGDAKGACIWYPEGAYPPPPRTYLRLVGAVWHLPTLAIPRALRALTTVQKKHPDEIPHLYVEVLGVDPETQGLGLGGALLGGVCDEADEKGLAVYLETTKEANVAYYSRFGFEIHDRAEFRGGPTYWLMLRPPS